jgi:hypothetical protein
MRMRRPRSQGRLATVAACVLTAGITAGSAIAAPGGNSANAKLCQKGGWQTLQTTSGELFANQGECVSYAARGGTLVAVSDPGGGSGGSE